MVALRSVGIAVGVGAFLVLGASVACAADPPRGWNGHLALGYALLFATDAPGGSLSAGAGMDYPVGGNLRAGVDLGYHLLGSRTVERGSLLATLDYSVFEAIAFLHWHPQGAGPLGRISAGPVLMSARSELSTSGGGAAFSDLAVEEVALGGALEATFMSSKPSPVRPALQIGARMAKLDTESWTIATARLAVHF